LSRTLLENVLADPAERDCEKREHDDRGGEEDEDGVHVSGEPAGLGLRSGRDRLVDGVVVEPRLGCRAVRAEPGRSRKLAPAVRAAHGSNLARKGKAS
jgi:hypothetical protein